MKGLKMILTGFLFTLTGIGLLAILVVPNSAYILVGPVTFSTAFPILPGTTTMQDYTNITNFIHVVESVSVLLILGGLVLSGFGVLHRDER